MAEEENQLELLERLIRERTLLGQAILQLEALLKQGAEPLKKGAAVATGVQKRRVSNAKGRKSGYRTAKSEGTFETTVMGSP